MQSWVIKVSVHNSWITEGFNLTKQKVEDMVRGELPFSFPSEVKVVIVSRPDKARVSKLQGGKK